MLLRSGERTAPCGAPSSGVHVGVDHIVVAGFQQPIDAAQGVLAASPGTEAVALLGEIPLKDRLQDVPRPPNRRPQDCR
jgi:hypothetical protein